MKKNEQHWGIVRMTRIFTDHWRSLKQVWTNNHRRNVDSTSTSSSNKWECIGRNAKEHGTRPRVVWQWPNKIWRLVERNEIVPQKQQGHGDRQQDHSDPSSPQRRCSRHLCTKKAQWARWRDRNPRLGRFYTRNQDHVQW